MNNRSPFHPAWVALSSLLILSALAAGQFAQNPPNRTQEQQAKEEQLRVETQIVQIDVVVADKAGKLVADLRREDFQLFEDGKPQELAFFSVGTVARPARWLTSAPDKRKSNEAEKPVPTAELDSGRHIVLAIDDLHLSAGNLMQAKQSLMRFVEQQLAGSDQVALITTSGALGMYEQFTTDRESLRRAINRLSVRERTVTTGMDIPRITPYQAELIERNDQDALNIAVNELVARLNLPRDMAVREVQGKARLIVAENTNVTTATLGTLENVIRGLKPLNGRKIIVLLSDGFLLGLGTGQGRESDMHRITDAATRSGAVIYSLDARGLIATPPGGDASQPGGFIDQTGARDRIDRASMEAQRDGLNALAYDTGGFAVFNNNDLNIGFQKVLADNETYYVLAYEPVTIWRDGRFHKIEVKIKDRPELKVRTRKGYLAPDEKAERKATEKTEKAAEKLSKKSVQEQEKKAQEVRFAEINTALGSLFPLRGIPVEMTADYIEAEETGPLAIITAQIDATTLKFESVGDRHEGIVEVVTMIYNEKGDVTSDLVDRLDMKLRQESLERVRRSGIRYSKSYQLKPGFYQVRMAIRQEGLPQPGSASQWVEIADTSRKQLVLSGIFMTSSAAQLQTTLASQNEQNNSQQQMTSPASVSRRFKRGESFDFTVFAYNARTDNKGVADLVIQSQVLSGNRVIYATPLTAIAPLPENQRQQKDDSLKPHPYAARLSLADFEPGTYELRLVVIDRLAKASTKRSINFTVE